jgi:hypothetical protein
MRLNNSVDWHLPPTVHVAAVDDDLVFLNVRSDSYACLPGGAVLAEICASGRDLRLCDPRLGEDLAAAGLVQSRREPAPSHNPLLLPRPTASALADTAERPEWRDFPQALNCLFDVLIRYRGRSFANILASATQGAADSVSDTPSAALISVVQGFHRWSPYLPVSGKCLLQSFMLLRLIRRSGHDAAWVFGVSTWPFRAHCWLQCGHVVLNDTFERVRAYQPIMVI